MEPHRPALAGRRPKTFRTCGGHLRPGLFLVAAVALRARLAFGLATGPPVTDSRWAHGPQPAPVLAIHLMWNTALTGATFDIGGVPQLVGT